MNTIPRRIVEAALKEAHLDYTDRITDRGPAQALGILVADVGEAMDFAFALGAVIERSSRVNDYFARMINTGRIIHPSGEIVLIFPGWALED